MDWFIFHNLWSFYFSGKDRQSENRSEGAKREGSSRIWVKDCQKGSYVVDPFVFGIRDCGGICVYLSNELLFVYLLLKLFTH